MVQSRWISKSPLTLENGLLRAFREVAAFRAFATFEAVAAFRAVEDLRAVGSFRAKFRAL